MAEGVEIERNWERVLVIVEPEFDRLKIPEFDRIVYSYDSDSYYKEIKEYLDYSYEKDIESMLNTKLCKGINNIFSSDYAIKDCSFYILVINRDNDIVIGQLSVRKTSEEDIWEVLLLCGYPGIKGVGSYLIDTLKTICEMNGIKKLILESVFDAVDFYKKKGFRTKDGLKMEKMV